MRLALLLCLVALPVWAAPPKGYQLVWSDDFTEPGLPDPAKWAYDTEANATGWYNNERQYYAASNPDYAHQSDGFLHITARRARLAAEPDFGGQDYASARLITRGKASWTYGYFEVRARLPCGQGTWPAIWMLGNAPVPWPGNGEIDIMEHVNSLPAIHGTVQSLATRGTSDIGGQAFPADPCTSFHDYQMLWTPSRISMAVDDKTYFTFDNPGTGSKAWPYDQSFHLLLNLAVGGNWPGAVDDGVFPVTFTIDHVRVYQR